MKLLNCRLENFASYKNLEFNYSDLGRALIYGHTGSGKSTLLDAPTWVLFGVTAKGGAVDEVRAWDTKTPTTGSLTVESGYGNITVTRIRGSAKENDLFWQTDRDPQKHRGKDITDTQRILNDLLGVNADLYATAAYFSEFSPASRFFTAKAKDRREVFEKVANLAFPVKLTAKAQEARKAAKQGHQKLLQSIANLEGKVASIESQLIKLKTASTAWTANRASGVKELEDKAHNFEVDRDDRLNALACDAGAWELERATKRADLTAEREQCLLVIKTVPASRPCSACGRGGDRPGEAELATRQLNSVDRSIAALDKEINPYYEKIKAAQNEKNHYQEQLAAKTEEVNPFDKEIKDLGDALLETANKLEREYVATNAAEHKVASLTHLLKLTDDLRGALLHRSVKDIQAETNRLLDAYFDAEIRVGFEIEAADNVAVSIGKSGHECSYTQLSKGQRGLLKLAFAVAVMRSASDRAGIHFDTLAFDESLDGLDGDLKAKAADLFAELALSHSSVLVIDHSLELREAFDKKYHVTLESDFSTIEEE